MTPLLFLTFHKAKNRLVELFHKPFKLAVYLGLVFLLVMNLAFPEENFTGDRPFYEFRAIIFAFYIICFITEGRRGFFSGATMFSPADVNLLFVSPVRASLILYKGILSRLGSSFYMALIFIYQLTALRSLYSVALRDIIAAVVGYGAVVFLSELTGMLIYFCTCGSLRRIKTAKAVFYSVCSLFLLAAAVRLFSYGSLSFSSAALSFTSLPMRFFPVAGWVYTAVDGIMLSDSLKLFLGILPSFVLAVLSVTVVAFSDKGYYEEVLLSLDGSADNKADEISAEISRKGSLKKGRGASVFFYKHRLENRRARSSVLSPSSLIYLVLIAVYGYLSDGSLTLLFIFSSMASFIPVLSGCWLKELMLPYAYLVPEGAFKKLFYILLEILPKLVAESVLQCALIACICDTSFGVFISVTVARLSVALVLVGSALLMARIFREREKNSVFLSLSIIPGLVFALASAAVCMAALNFGLGVHIALGVMSAVNTLLFLLLLFLSRNILKISE